MDIDTTKYEKTEYSHPFSPRIHPNNDYELGFNENNSFPRHNVYLPRNLPDCELVRIEKTDGTIFLFEPHPQDYGYYITVFNPI